MSALMTPSPAAGRSMGEGASSYRKNKMSKFSEGKGAIYFDHSVIFSVASLTARSAAGLVTKQDGSRARGFRFLKTEFYFFLRSLAATETLIIGLGGPGLTVVEIEEAIEADPQSPNDVSAAEHSMRFVTILGMVSGGTSRRVQIDGTVNLRWSYPESESMFVFAYNPDDADLSAASQEVIWLMKHYGVWLND